MCRRGAYFASFTSPAVTSASSSSSFEMANLLVDWWTDDIALSNSQTTSQLPSKNKMAINKRKNLIKKNEADFRNDRAIRSVSSNTYNQYNLTIPVVLYCTHYFSISNYIM